MTFLLVFSRNFKACQDKQGAQISLLFKYNLSMLILATFMLNLSQPTYQLAILTNHDSVTNHGQKAVPLALNCKVLSHLK